MEPTSPTKPSNGSKGNPVDHLKGWLEEAGGAVGAGVRSSSLLLSSLQLGDEKVYAPYIRAQLGTAAHICRGVQASERFALGGFGGGGGWGLGV